MKPQQSWSAKRATREPGNQSATTSNMVFQLNDAVRLFGKAKKPFLATRGAFYVILATIILFFMAAAAFAGPDRVSILIGSRHYPSGNYEELNPGVFVGWYDNRGNDWTVGAYRNSYGDPSVALTRGWAINPSWSIVAGVAHYPDADRHFKYHAGNLIPVVGVRYQKGNVFVQAIPGVFAFGLTFRIGGN